MRKKFIRCYIAGILMVTMAGCASKNEVYLESYAQTEQIKVKDCDAKQSNLETETVMEAGTSTGDETGIKTGTSIGVETGIETGASTGTRTSIEEVPEPTCYVYVCGAVQNPGVYSLPSGSRIIEAIELAGGLTEDADAYSINLAAEIMDGMMLRIYTYEEVEADYIVPKLENVKFSTEDDRININMASVQDLMQLPGIGMAKAEAIVDYRNAHGAFSKIEDLMKIPGIKEGIFEQIKEQIKVEEKR